MPTVATVIRTWRRPAPVLQCRSIRLEDLDLERMACRSIAGMGCATVSTGTGRQRAEQVDLREKLDEVAGTDRTCLHEILVRVLREAGAHEDVEHVVDMMLDYARLHLELGGKRAGQVGMAAEIVSRAVQQEICIGIAARADDIM